MCVYTHTYTHTHTHTHKHTHIHTSTRTNIHPLFLPSVLSSLNNKSTFVTVLTIASTTSFLTGLNTSAV